MQFSKTTQTNLWACNGFPISIIPQIHCSQWGLLFNMCFVLLILCIVQYLVITGIRYLVYHGLWWKIYISVANFIFGFLLELSFDKNHKPIMVSHIECLFYQFFVSTLRPRALPRPIDILKGKPLKCSGEMRLTSCYHCDWIFPGSNLVIGV